MQCKFVNIGQSFKFIASCLKIFSICTWTIFSAFFDAFWPHANSEKFVWKETFLYGVRPKSSKNAEKIILGCYTYRQYFEASGNSKKASRKNSLIGYIWQIRLRRGKCNTSQCVNWVTSSKIKILLLHLSEHSWLNYYLLFIHLRILTSPNLTIYHII